MQVSGAFATFMPALACTLPDAKWEALGPVVILTMKKAQGEWRVANGAVASSWLTVVAGPPSPTLLLRFSL
eukprot:scaffold147328_cov21-Tisochrysis_lutea.AAC.1